MSFPASAVRIPDLKLDRSDVRISQTHTTLLSLGDVQSGYESGKDSQPIQATQSSKISISRSNGEIIQTTMVEEIDDDA
jgi:hypothetical protein